MILPILKIKGTLIACIHRQIEDEEALVFQQELLGELQRLESSWVIIDISAMNIIDSYMSRVLLNIGSSCAIMGAEVVISGLQPEVAITLIEMGRHIDTVRSATDLEHALEIAGVEVLERR